MKRILISLLALLMLVSCGQGTLEQVSDTVSDTVSEQVSEVAYTIGGVELSDFAILGSGGEYSTLKKIIYELTGKRPQNQGDKTIYFDTDETLGAIYARAVYNGDDIVIYTSGTGITQKEGAEIIYKIFESKNNEKENFDMTEKIIPEGLNVATDEYISQLRDDTDKRIAEIRNTPNMVIPEGARVFYVSNNGKDTNDGRSPKTAFKTIEKISSIALTEGDFVLFERGGYFRGPLKVNSGVTYSAYGEGEKPIIVRSPEDGADPKKWVNVGGNVWEYETVFDLDVGTLVFNHGEAHTIKWLVFKNEAGVLEEFRTKTAWNGVTTMTEDLHFWHSTENKKIYLVSETNPGERFNSIEFSVREHAIIGGASHDVTFDNLTVKYTGAHGIGGGYKQNLKVQNCTFEWIGGSIQYVDYSGKAARPVRFGNGVEIYGGCNGFVIDNCYFDQIYDAAVTHQYAFDNGSTSQEDFGQYNVSYTNNVMEHCVYSIEYFLGRVPNDNKSCLDNVLYENNLMWYAGQGLGSQRPDNTSPAHIKGWGHINPVKNFVIKNNLLVHSTSMLIHTSFRNENEDGSNGVKLVDNIIIGEYGQSFGMFGFDTRDKKVNYTSEIEEYLKDFSSGNKFYFLDK